MSEPRNRGAPSSAHQIDWREAAQQLASGATIKEAAKAAGCTQNRLRARLRSDPDLQQLIENTPTTDHGILASLSAEGDLTDLESILREAIAHEVRAGNVRVVLWLADRLKLANPHGDRSSESRLEELIQSLTAEELRELESLRDPHERGAGRQPD